MSEKSANNGDQHISDPAMVNAEFLLPIVQRAYGEQFTEISDFSSSQLGGGIGGGSIVRFSGQGRVQGGSVDWSVILKKLRPGAKGENDANITGWNYYKREADAYRSGWLNDLPGGIAAPQFLGISEFPDGVCWLWLEDISHSLEQWTLEDYGRVACDIGLFNGAYLTSTPLPQHAWLSSKWIRNYVSLSAPAIEPIRNSLDHPLIKRWFPGNSSERFFRLWNQREIDFKIMDQLPQTICHFDLFRRNLFLSNDPHAPKHTIAIDWAFVGTGCIGADISPLVAATLGFFEVGLDKTRELDQIVFNGYMDGLHQAGWHGDVHQARLGYLCANIRYAFPEIGAWFAAIFDDNIQYMIEQAFGHPLGEMFDYIAMCNDALSCFEEERDQLIKTLGYG